MKLASVVGVAALCAACGGAAVPPPAATDPEPGSGAAQAAVEETAAPPREEFRELTIPAGTTLRLTLRSGIGSDTSRVEDAVRAELREGVRVEGETALPAGAEVTGIVTDVQGSGRVKGRARIAYQFQSLRAGGERYDIRTASVSHVAPATKGEDATKIAIGAGAGAAIGALLGGGGGAAKGAAIGGAGGTGAVLATKGREVRLGPGARVTVKLTAPLTVRVKA